VHITTEDGKTTVFEAGDAFFIELGTVLAWVQPGLVRKYYVIHSEETSGGDSPPQTIQSRL
jgi:uncharacterized cupin superfamily protein